MQVITILEPTPSQNVILRQFKNIHARRKEQERWDWMVRGAIEVAPTIGCCEITVTRYGVKLLDWDNMGAGLKFLMDALVHNRVILDDNPEVVIRLHLEQRKSNRKEARTTIEIIELDWD